MKMNVKINGHKSLNIFLVFSFFVLLMSLYNFIEVKKRHIWDYFLLPHEKNIIELNEIFEENRKKFCSIYKKEKKELFENYHNFIKLNNEEKTNLLRNYVEFLNFDFDTRENLRQIYKEFFIEDL